MPQSITNMSQVWMDTNTRNSISMSVSTLGYGTNINSKLLNFSVDGDRKFAVDTSGRRSNPYNPIFYGVISDGGGWRNLGVTPVILKMNAVGINQVNHYNTSTGYFTCPIAGVYKVTIWALCGNGGSYYNMYVHKNGSNVSYNGMHTNTNGYNLWMQSTVEVFVSCSVNDTLAAFGASGSTGFYTSDGYTGMTIEYIA